MNIGIYFVVILTISIAFAKLLALQGHWNTKPLDDEEFQNDCLVTFLSMLSPLIVKVTGYKAHILGTLKNMVDRHKG